MVLQITIVVNHLTKRLLMEAFLVAVLIVKVVIQIKIVAQIVISLTKIMI